MPADRLRQVCEHLEQRVNEYWQLAMGAYGAERTSFLSWYKVAHEQWGRSLERLSDATRHHS